MKKNILCTICARGGSKGVKNKNIRNISGKPLIAYSIEQARASGLCEHVVISTDSDVIAQTAVNYGAEGFFKRTAELASDTAGKLDVIRDAFIRSESYFAKRFDYLIDLDATSPLRSPQDIIDAFAVFEKGGHGNLFSAMPARRSPYFNLVERSPDGKVSLSKSLPESILRRQDSPECYDMNASIYIWGRETILNEKTLFLENTGLYVMPEERSIDIDTELDFFLVETLLNRDHAKD